MNGRQLFFLIEGRLFNSHYKRLCESPSRARLVTVGRIQELGHCTISRHPYTTH